MKQLLLFFLTFTTATAAFGQCEAPVVTFWNASDPENVIISFQAPEGTESYKLRLFGQYDQMVQSFEDYNQFDAAQPGENIISVDLTNISENESFINLFYFSAELSVFCTDGSQSGKYRFYISSFSMRNNSAIEFGEFFQPLMYLPDGAGLSYEAYLTITPESGLQAIDDMSVFVDIGHTYARDLTIELINPQGQAVVLFEGTPVVDTQEEDLSVIFSDGPHPSPDSMAVLYGFLQPLEPLSAFSGTDPTGTWTLRVTDNYGIDNGVLFGAGLIINRLPCNAKLQGIAYFDWNANGTKDPLEPGMPSPLISASPDMMTIGNNSGEYALCVENGQGTLSLVNLPLYHTSPPVPYSVNEGEILNNLDFPLQPVPGIEDLKISAFLSAMPLRPGFNSSFTIQYANIGTECLQNVEISVQADPGLTILSVNDQNAVINGSEIVLQIPELCPQSDSLFNFTVLTADTVSIGTSSTISATILPDTEDETPENNHYELTTPVVGSYDPNDKSVSDTVIYPPFLTGQKPLGYVVRFQNTGTFYAERVVIVDTLDSHLNPATFSLGAHSHPVEVTHSGNVFYFTFDNIFLPDSSTDETGSHGYLRYEAIPYPGLSEGTTIENTAYIFFDFNDAIITNTVTTTVNYPAAVSELVPVAQVFPNPATENIILGLQGTPIRQVSIFTLTGQRVLSLSGNGQSRVDLSIADLTPGSYLVRINSGQGIKPILFVKQ